MRKCICCGGQAVTKLRIIWRDEVREGVYCARDARQVRKAHAGVRNPNLRCKVEAVKLAARKAARKGGAS